MSAFDYHELSHSLLAFYERFASWEHGVVAASELSPAQMHAVEMVGYLEGPTMKALAKSLGITTGSVTAMIDRLVSMGIVERNTNPADKRSFILELTKKGQVYYDEHCRHHLQLTEEICSCLSEDEVRKFYETLQRITRNL